MVSDQFDTRLRTLNGWAWATPGTKWKTASNQANSHRAERSASGSPNCTQGIYEKSSRRLSRIRGCLFFALPADLPRRTCATSPAELDPTTNAQARRGTAVRSDPCALDGIMLRQRRRAAKETTQQSCSRNTDTRHPEEPKERYKNDASISQLRPLISSYANPKHE